jgi:integrase/recombinase XerD
MSAIDAEPDLLPLEVEEHLSWLATERGRVPNTISAYRRDLRAYTTWLHAHETTVTSATEDDVTRYIASLRASRRAPASVSRAVVAIRSLHRFLASEGTTGLDATAAVDVPRVPAGLPKALTETEVGSLLAAVVGDEPVARRDRAILEVLYGTGLRISELVGMSLADLDLGAALLRAMGKGSKERIVPVGRHAADALERWLGPGGRPDLAPVRWARRGDSEAVFLNVRGGRLSRQGAWGIVRRCGDQVGLGARLTPHVLRHSCATHMLDHGADIRSVQELLGHASISTTQVYTLVSNDRLWEVYRSAHPRARGER